MKESFFILLLILLLPGSLPAKDDSDKLKELKAKTREVEYKKTNLKQTLKTIDKTIFLAGSKIKQIENDLFGKKREIEDVNSEIRINRLEMNRTALQKKRKIESFYLAALPEMENPYSKFTDTSEYMATLIQNDSEKLGHYKNVCETKIKLKENSEQLATELAANLQNCQKKTFEMGMVKKKNQILLASLEKQSVNYRKEIEKVLTRLAQKENIPKGVGLAKYKGSLPWPSRGTVIKTFGAYRENGVKLLSQGVDIRLSDETSVRSIYQGKVVYSDSIEPYGKTIIIEHGNGFYSVYANLSDVFKNTGDTVGPNDKIGKAGHDSDGINLVHFEIRHKGKPQDPVVWLKK